MKCNPNPLGSLGHYWAKIVAMPVLILSYSQRATADVIFLRFTLEARKLVLISVHFLPRKTKRSLCERSLRSHHDGRFTNCSEH